jgi:hypothetical protein
VTSRALAGEHEASREAEMQEVMGDKLRELGYDAG